MALLTYQNGEWIFGGTKHSGHALEKVAQEDPGYLFWAWNKVGPTMDDKTFYALVDMMDKHKISFKKAKKKKTSTPP